MGSKTCTYMLHTIRKLQPCYSLAASFPIFTRSYRLKAVLPQLSDTCSLRSTCSSASVPIRYISHETSPCTMYTPDSVDGWVNNSSTISQVSPVSPSNEKINLKEDGQAGSCEMFQSFTMITLYKCSTPREVLKIFSRRSYKKDELFEGVLKLWRTFLALDKEQKLLERDIIVGHPHFKNLTKGISKIAPVLLPGALVRTLYVFVRLKIEQQSEFIQNLLLLCQRHLSSFNEVELAILANTLEWLSSDKNVDMLKFGIRLLIDTRIEEVTEVTPLLAMIKAAGGTAPLRVKLKLQNKALQMVDKFSAEQCEGVISALAGINLYSEPLLRVCSDKIIDGIDELSYPKIVSLLSCSCKVDYSNEKMLTVIGDQIMKTICLWKPQQLALILRYFAHLRLRHVPLLDRYTDIFKDNLNSVKIRDLSAAVNIYSQLNHLPEKNAEQFLKALSTLLQANLDSIPRTKLVYIVYDLCVLGACPEIALNKLLQYENILSQRERRILMHIKLCSMVDKPLSDRLSFQCLENVPNSVSEDIRTFHTGMKNFIGNPDLYQHNLWIANTYYIDFVLALNTQEKKLVPVSDIQTDNPQIDDYSGNIDHVAVLCCTPNAFALGTLHPLGKLALKMRILRSLGFSVVVVPVQSFIEMPEGERLEFIRSIIFHAVSDNENALEDLQQSPP